MKLTPLDIRHREFRRAMRGYADEEVDEFLDEVAEEFERLFKENIEVRDRLEAAEEKLAGYRRIEETLQKTLLNAQAAAEEQKQNAAKEAELILQDAQLKAREIVNEAYAERQKVEQAIARLRNAEQALRLQVRQLLERFMKYLEEGEAPPAATPAHDELARRADAIKETLAREAAASGGAAAAPQPRPAAEAGPGAAEETAPRPAGGEAAPATPPAAAQEGVAGPGAAGHGRPVLGEDDDLLADVDPGVGDDEFRW